MELVFATQNKNKIAEVQAMMPEGVRILSLDEIGCTEQLEETQNTIEGNAIQKAKYVYDKYRYDCFADDTGLEVDALNGEPGVYSARYAGDNCSSTDNIDKLLQSLKDLSNREARFKTIVALVINNKAHTFEGICRGEITHSEKGEKGFGYDPVFKPAGHDKTFAEMEAHEKNAISHRAKAIKQLIEFVNGFVQIK